LRSPGLTRATATAIFVAAFAAFPAFTEAQAAPTYRAPEAPLNWISDNPFHLFLVRGEDTVTAPVRAISVFRESWHPATDGFDVIRASVDLGLGNRTRTDTLSVTRTGTVLRVNGESDYNEGEWDALLRLPAVPLREGLEWSDTLSHPTSGPAAGGRFEARRHYRVARNLDSPDSTGFVVDIRGEILFNLAMWTDSTAGHYRWFELKGPVEEQFVFDPASGQLHRRNWSMLLEGIGGDHDGTSTDTVPAGLHSRNSRYRIPAARAAALMAQLPGADTSITVTADGTVLFAHTIGRDGSILSEGFRRADGKSGRAELKVANNMPVRWTFSWVEPGTDESTVTLARDGVMLLRDGNRVEPPASNWGIAEYGMLGTLVPSLDALSTAQTSAFAIYRPTPAEWDMVRVTRRALPNATFYVLMHDGGGMSAVLVDRKGMLLYVEVRNADGSRMVRVPASESRQAEVQQAMQALRVGSPP
jgi:hypothetical protein